MYNCVRLVRTSENTEHVHYNKHLVNAVQGNKLCMIPGFCTDVNEICTFLRYYTAQGSNSVPTFGDNLSVPSSRVKKHSWTYWPLKIGLIGCPETSVRITTGRCVVCHKSADLSEVSCVYCEGHTKHTINTVCGQGSVFLKLSKPSGNFTYDQV
jgi:hypothetical protein